MNTTLNLTGGYLKPIELRVDRNDQHKDVKRLERMNKLRAHLMEAITTPANYPMLMMSRSMQPLTVYRFKSSRQRTDFLTGLNDSDQFRGRIITEGEINFLPSDCIR